MEGKKDGSVPLAEAVCEQDRFGGTINEGGGSVTEKAAPESDWGAIVFVQ